MSKVINLKDKTNQAESKLDYMAMCKSAFPELHEILTHYNYKLVFVDGNAFVETDTDLIPLDLFCAVYQSYAPNNK